MVELAQRVNDRMPQYVVQRAATLLNEHGKSARSARVLLLGVTYKPDVADQQGTPAREIALRLMELGASVSYHDPHVPAWSVLDRPTPRRLPLRGRRGRRPDDPAPATSDVRPAGTVGEGAAAAGHAGATPAGAAHRL
jgi:UDP-N-acetyl-D-glucosamine dehydrogenase